MRINRIKDILATCGPLMMFAGLLGLAVLYLLDNYTPVFNTGGAIFHPVELFLLLGVFLLLCLGFLVSLVAYVMYLVDRQGNKPGKLALLRAVFLVVAVMLIAIRLYQKSHEGQRACHQIMHQHR